MTKDVIRHLNATTMTVTIERRRFVNIDEYAEFFPPAPLMPL